MKTKMPSPELLLPATELRDTQAEQLELMSHNLGHTALEEELALIIADGQDEIQIGNDSYRTTLPEGTNPFIIPEYNEGLRDAELVPTLLGSIPAGEYSVTDDSANATRTIDIHAGTHGPTINRESFKNASKWTLNPESSELFSSLGYEIGDATIVDEQIKPTRVPLPETIVATAKEHGLDIQLFQENGLISPSDYLQAFADEKYPVSTATEEYYKHDISDTHLKVMLLGGADIKGLLKRVAAETLIGGDQDKIGVVAGIVDRYTEALSDIYDELGYSHSGAIELGQSVGITQEETRALIATIQANAKTVGITPPAPKVAAKPVNVPGS